MVAVIPGMPPNMPMLWHWFLPGPPQLPQIPGLTGGLTGASSGSTSSTATSGGTTSSPAATPAATSSISWLSRLRAGRAGTSVSNVRRDMWPKHVAVLSYDQFDSLIRSIDSEVNSLTNTLLRRILGTVGKTGLGSIKYIGKGFTLISAATGLFPSRAEELGAIRFRWDDLRSNDFHREFTYEVSLLFGGFSNEIQVRAMCGDRVMDTLLITVMNNAIIGDILSMSIDYRLPYIVWTTTFVDGNYTLRP